MPKNSAWSKPLHLKDKQLESTLLLPTVLLLTKKLSKFLVMVIAKCLSQVKYVIIPDLPSFTSWIGSENQYWRSQYFISSKWYNRNIRLKEYYYWEGQIPVQGICKSPFHPWIASFWFSPQGLTNLPFLFLFFFSPIYKPSDIVLSFCFLLFPSPCCVCYATQNIFYPLIWQKD